MTRQIKITVLVENTAKGRGLLGEHGLSYAIELDNQTILMDTGQGAVLTNNAHRLGIRLENTNAVLLSHGHYDHTGALQAVLQAAPTAEIFAHPDAIKPKYARNDNGASRFIGISKEHLALIEKLDQQGQICWNTKPQQVVEGLFLTGPIDRNTDFEDTGGPFFTDPACQHPDLLLDDQSLYFNTDKGIVVVLGCAHSGVINTLEQISRQTNGQPIYMVMGGMHLGAASKERINKTIDAFKKLNIQRLAPAHCTGMEATTAIWHAFEGQCCPCIVGAKMTFELT